MESSSIAKHEVKMNYHALEQEIKVWIRENGCFMYPNIFFLAESWTILVLKMVNLKIYMHVFSGILQVKIEFLELRRERILELTFIFLLLI